LVFIIIFLDLKRGSSQLSQSSQEIPVKKGKSEETLKEKEVPNEEK
jgi:hypothetical protein